MMKLHAFVISGEERVMIGEVDAIYGGRSSVEINKLFLIKTSGTIRIEGSPQKEDFEVYFHVPIPFEEQRPISMEIQCPNLIDYRFISHNPPNVLVAARLTRSDFYIPLYWTVWVLVKENLYSNLPTVASFPVPDELPSNTIKWLESTDCVQVDAEVVQSTSNILMGSANHLLEFADRVCQYCKGIPRTWQHHPASFDAVYALNWGGSCVSKAHAAAALLRFNDVPTKVLLNLPTWTGYYYYMHWIPQYFIPEYGWVRMEISENHTSGNPSYPKDEIVVYVCNPEDEFPLFGNVSARTGDCYYSDPGVYDTIVEHNAWEHSVFDESLIDKGNAFAQNIFDEAFMLTDSVFSYYSQYQGILSEPDQTTFRAALQSQSTASQMIQDNDLDAYITNIEQALNLYRQIDVAPVSTIYAEDFENNVDGWTHGGDCDEWEWGSPTVGPTEPHSGNKCWGTDLDDSYENSADAWLLSPSIDLSGYRCATLHFWVWNWVEFDPTQEMSIIDPLWVEISTDRLTFIPITIHMKGANNNPEIPAYGGWSMLALDLTKYTDQVVSIRFRFQSNASVVWPGSYIDDIHIFGRKKTSTFMKDQGNRPESFTLLQNYPNPFNMSTAISLQLSRSEHITMDIFDINGRKINRLFDGILQAGQHRILWNGTDYSGDAVPSGVYFYRIQSNKHCSTNKMILSR